MDYQHLLLEIGSIAYSDLSDEEVQLILRAYNTAQIHQAGMKAFDLLRKKFKATYRMGRAYEDLSRKYEAYDAIYKEYAQGVRAGRLGHTVGDERNIQRYKFTEETHDKQSVIDANE